ncbi:MAG: ABC transporter substrate-binding protein, partial [Acidimicrobiia bacterium]|nr:ABC transporter substrate-binding protein [Acidimicrobiia bacterium]
MKPRTAAAVVALCVVAAACASDDPTTGEPADATPGGDQVVDGEETADEPGAENVDGDASSTPDADLIPDDALIIGAIIDRTGIMRTLDEPALEAARIQVARINEQGGVLGRPLVLEEFDSRSQLNASFQAAQELVDDGAELLFVTCDFEFARPAIEVAAEAGVLVLSPCGGTSAWGDPAIGGPHVFSFAMPSASEGTLMADYVLERYGSLVTMIVDATDPDAQAQCSGFEERFREQGGSFRGRLEVDIESAPELQENVGALVRTSFTLPSAVVLCSSPTVGKDIVLYLRRSGLESVIVAGSTMDGDDWIVDVERTGEMVVLSYASVYGDDPDPAVADLFAEYAV